MTWRPVLTPLPVKIIEIIKTEPVIISVVRVRGFRLDQQLVLDAEAGVELCLHPAGAVKLKITVKRLGLYLRLCILQISLHLIAGLMPIFFERRLTSDWKIACVMNNLKLTKDSSTW